MNYAIRTLQVIGFAFVYYVFAIISTTLLICLIKLFIMAFRWAWLGPLY